MKINQNFENLIVTHLANLSDGEVRKTLDAVLELLGPGYKRKCRRKKEGSEAPKPKVKY